MRAGKRSRTTTWLAVGLLTIVSAGPTLPPASAKARRSTAKQNLETFDAAWKLVADTHFDPDLNGVDWDAVYKELRPRAKAAADRRALREVLREMVGRLGQSHFYFLAGDETSATSSPDSAADEPLPEGCAADSRTSLVRALHDSSANLVGQADAGLELRVLDDEVVVFRVHRGSSPEEYGVQPGWRVVAIDSKRVEDALPCLAEYDGVQRRQVLRLWLEELLRGAKGTSLPILLEDSQGAPHAIDLERRPAKGEVVGFGNLPPTRTRFDLEWVSSAQGGRVGVVTFNIWLMPVARAFEAAMDELREADGIVIDLRGNPGGVAGIALGMAGHLLDEKVSIGTMRTRKEELHFNVNPRRSTRDGRRVVPYGGPLAIVVDGFSASTSEIFAAALQDLGRARLFGEPTAGAALPSVAERLPNGDIFLHATMDLVRPNGERIEGRPVAPDEVVRTTREQLLAGVDAPLERALEWIEEENRRGD